MVNNLFLQYSVQGLICRLFPIFGIINSGALNQHISSGAHVPDLLLASIHVMQCHVIT